MPDLRAGNFGERLREEVESIDRIEVVLLDSFQIGHYPDWRDRYASQMFGYGVRSTPQRMAAADVDSIKALLLDPGHWTGETKACLASADAALVMTSRRSEVLVFLELWCARAEVRTNAGSFVRVHGNVDVINESLLRITRRYFPEDRHLARLAVEEKR